MTRQEYLNELKYCLRTLPVEEQEEALEYYRGYFEDADDDQAVMKEFGTPEELAKTIAEKFSSVPEKKSKKTNKNKSGNCGDFSNDEVRSLDISLGAAEIVMITDEHFSVEYRNLNPGDIKYGLSPFGTFSIENVKKFPDFTKWKHSDTNGLQTMHPRILIRIPENLHLDLFKLHVGAGAFTTEDVSIYTSRSYIDVGAGSIILRKIYGGAAEIKCGMGNLSYTGTMNGLVKIDCGMGSITLNLKGRKDDYSIAGNVGLGTVKFNDISKELFGSINCQEQKKNHFSFNCGMGSIKINMND